MMSTAKCYLKSSTGTTNLLNFWIWRCAGNKAFTVRSFHRKHTWTCQYVRFTIFVSIEPGGLWHPCCTQYPRRHSAILSTLTTSTFRPKPQSEFTVLIGFICNLCNSKFTDLTIQGIRRSYQGSPLEEIHLHISVIKSHMRLQQIQYHSSSTSTNLVGKPIHDMTLPMLSLFCRKPCSLHEPCLQPNTRFMLGGKRAVKTPTI